jgi:hypothetical protein
MLQSPRLEDILAAFEVMTPEEKNETIKAAMEETGHLPWVPSPGGQTAALHSEADELFTGGEPGGGKSSLLVGAAVTQHQSSIIFRRQFPQIKGLVKEATRILGSRDGYNSQDHVWRIPGTSRVLEFGSVPHEWDVEKYQGHAHDLKGFDEITHFSRSQYQYLTLWLRSAIPGQRCRIICTGNPPTTAEGLWVVQHWAPWLDENYPDRAAPGELRWAAPKTDGSDDELFFESLEEAKAHVEKLRKPPRDPKGNLILPRSRTFIPSKMEDIPELANSGYGAVLAYAPTSLRNLASGTFSATLQDQNHQVIPTEWIVAAMDRWKDDGWRDWHMTAMAFDPAGGGKDAAVLAWRHRGWYAPLVSQKGKQTSDSTDATSAIFHHRRDAAPVVLDVGGGYAGPVKERLRDNKIAFVDFNGANKSTGKALGSNLPFANKRAEAWFRFREALDPEQLGGSIIALPPDAELKADLAAPCINPRVLEIRGEIQIESKEDLRKRLGRSPDKGDAVVMCLSEGNAAVGRTHWTRPEPQTSSRDWRGRRRA